jgi:hypothetical protein
MMDVDAAITAELERLFPISATPDWEAIAAATGLRRERRLAPLVVVIAVGLVAIGFATPLGAAIAHSIGGFSDWLTGEPGKPAPESQQARFARANAQQWLGFPKDTKLRDLTSQGTVNLAGFRTGSSICLHVSVRGTGQTNCAPLADLERRDAPVRVLFADLSFGKGSKSEVIGLGRIHSAKLQVTAGIVADGVRSVVLLDDKGRHTVPVVSDAFLYVATAPNVGQRVTRVWARTAARLVRVPFAPAPFLMPFFSRPPRTGPAVAVSAPAANGRIGWLDHRQAVGLPLSSLPLRIRSELLGYRLGRVIFGRVLAPDPSLRARFVITLNASWRGGQPRGVCLMFVGASGDGGGCAPYPQLFAKTPLNVGQYDASGSDQFTTVSGIVSDDVARLRAKLANGQWVDVPLAENTFIAELPMGRLPARIVAFDSKGRTIGASQPIGALFAGQTGPSPLRGRRPKQILAIRGAHGMHAELLVGPATNGGTCFYVNHYISKHAAGGEAGCSPAAWRGSPLALEWAVYFISGRVRPDVTDVVVRFTDGTKQTLHVSHPGYMLALVPPTKRLLTMTALNGSGKVLGVDRLPQPKKRH